METSLEVPAGISGQALGWHQGMGWKGKENAEFGCHGPRHGGSPSFLPHLLEKVTYFKLFLTPPCPSPPPQQPPKEDEFF